MNPSKLKEGKQNMYEFDICKLTGKELFNVDPEDYINIIVGIKNECVKRKELIDEYRALRFNYDDFIIECFETYAKCMKIDSTNSISDSVEKLWNKFEKLKKETNHLEWNSNESIKT